MTYRYSHRKEGPWFGTFDHPQKALEAGRAVMDTSKVWVGRMEPAYFSDCFIGGKVLLDYMQETAETYGDEFVESFERLPTAMVSVFDRYIRDAIGEFETDLPDELQFTGEIVKTKMGYVASAQVRKPHFAPDRLADDE